MAGFLHVSGVCSHPSSRSQDVTSTLEKGISKSPFSRERTSTLERSFIRTTTVYCEIDLSHFRNLSNEGEFTSAITNSTPFLPLTPLASRRGSIRMNSVLRQSSNSALSGLNGRPATTAAARMVKTSSASGVPLPPAMTRRSELSASASASASCSRRCVRGSAGGYQGVSTSRRTAVESSARIPVTSTKRSKPINPPKETQTRTVTAVPELSVSKAPQNKPRRHTLLARLKPSLLAPLRPTPSQNQNHKSRATAAPRPSLARRNAETVRAPVRAAVYSRSDPYFGRLCKSKLNPGACHQPKADKLYTLSQFKRCPNMAETLTGVRVRAMMGERFPGGDDKYRGIKDGLGVPELNLLEIQFMQHNALPVLLNARLMEV